MEVGPLDREQLVRSAAGLAVNSSVDFCAEPSACQREICEALIARTQVGLGGHKIGLGKLDGRLGTALGLGIEWHAGEHLRAIVATGGDDLGVADGDACDAIGRDRALVVGQEIRGHPADGP